MRLLVNIDVPDVATAERFTAASGLRPSRRFGADGVELLGAGVPLYLLRKPPGSIAAAGSRQEGARRDATWGSLVQLADPFGHGWCLTQFSIAGYEAVTTPA